MEQSSIEKDEFIPYLCNHPNDVIVDQILVIKMMIATQIMMIMMITFQ
jgi:hypothetical protein